MSDWKTAAELRKEARTWPTCTMQGILLHLAAVEEERAAAAADSKAEALALSLRADLDDARRELDVMTRIADEQREAAKAARERALDAVYASHRKAVDAERLAADALRIGLEECERLRREVRGLKVQLIDAEEEASNYAQQAAELDAMTRDREKVGEWWEVWCETGVVDVYRQRASAQRWARVDGDRLVHVTRWRKR